MYKWQITGDNGFYVKGVAKDFLTAQAQADRAFLVTNGVGEIEVGPAKRWKREKDSPEWVRQEITL